MVDFLALLPLGYAAVIILFTWLVARFSGILLRRVMRQSTPLVSSQTQRLVSLLVWLVGLVLAVEQLGVRSDILLVLVGLLGAGAIVAAREPLENFAAKYFNDMYAAFKVGDSIQVRGYSGKVIEINSMGTVLLTEDDHLVTIPNATITKEAIVNTTPQAWKELIIPVTIGNEIDLPTFESAVLKSIGKLRLRLDRRFPPLLTVKSRTPQSTEAILTVMIQRPEQRDSIVSEVNKRITEVIENMQRQKPTP